MNFLQRSRALQTSCHHVLKSLRDCSKASSLPLYSKTATMATIGTPQSQNTASLEVEACVSQDTNSSFFLGLNPSRPQSNLVNFTSAEGKRLFRGAMDQGQAESFFKLMGNFSTQSSAMLGGISSLTMALNALEIDPGKRWKGNWRWYSHELLETCSSKEEVLKRGMSFDEFTRLAQSHCKIQPRRASSVSYQQFIADLLDATSNKSQANTNSRIMVVSYSRSRLGQSEQRGGHFSPIGAYNKAEDMVLIMDVARGEYPSVWVNAQSLYNAMLERERDIMGRSRGYFIMQAHISRSAISKEGSNDQPLIKCDACSRRCSKRRLQADNA